GQMRAAQRFAAPAGEGGLAGDEPLHRDVPPQRGDEVGRGPVRDADARVYRGVRPEVTRLHAPVHPGPPPRAAQDQRGRPHLARVEGAHPLRVTPADSQIRDVFAGEAALEHGRIERAAPAALEDARASEADGLRPGRPQGTADAHEQRIRGRNVRAARFEREVRLAVDGDGTLYVGLGGRRLQLRVLHELGPVLGAPDDATAQRRAAVVTGHEVEGGPSAEGAPAASRPANGDLARGRGSQAGLADAEEVAGRLFRVDALDL